MQSTLATLTGTPLLYYYGKGYWVTARTDQALATMADERESMLRREQEQTCRENEALGQAQVQLRRENEDLKCCLQELHQKHGHAALGLVQASLEAGKAIATLSPSDGHPQPAVMYATPSRQLMSHAVTPPGADTQATAMPQEPIPAGTCHLQPASKSSNHMPKAARQLGRVFGVNKSGFGSDTTGQLQAALGQPVTGPRAPGTAPPGVFEDARDLRQGLACLLQQMTQLAANLHEMEQQQPQKQPSFENRSLNQLEPQQAQHGAIDAHELMRTSHHQDTLLAAAEHLVSQIPTSHKHQSMHSMRREAVQTCKNPPGDELLSAAVVRQQQEASLQAVPPAGDQHAGETMQVEAHDTATNEAAVPSGTEHVPGDKLAGREKAGTIQPVAPQALAVTVQKATKRNADKDSKPRRSKKRKGNEITGTEGADSSSQPQAAAEGQPLQGGPLQWGGKQKRKHTRQASCGLPDQAHGASQQRLLRPYLATPPVVAHPSKGDLPAATVSAAASPDGLCDAKGARARCLSSGFQSTADLNKPLRHNANPKEDGGHTHDDSDDRADANGPRADAHSPMMHHLSNPLAGVSTTETAARGADGEGPAAQSLDHINGEQQAQGLSRFGGGMSSGSSSSSSGEEEHSGDENGLVMSHVEACTDGAVAGARALATCSAAARAEGWAATNPPCTQQGRRADASSPEIEVSIDRESDSGADQVRAQQNGCAASSPAAASFHTGSTPEDLAPKRAEGNLGHPEGCSPWAVSHHIKAEIGSSSQAVTTNGSMQTATVIIKHDTAAAAAAAEPVLADTLRSSPASHPAGSQAAMPSGDVHESSQQMRSESKPAAGSCEANTASGVPQPQLHSFDAKAPASEACKTHDALVNMCGSMCKSLETAFGDTGDQITLGRRKRARKSIRSLCRQPAASVQQSNAHVSEGAKSVPNSSYFMLTKHDESDTDVGRDGSSNRPLVNHDVIDLTDD
ncbi:hypothetical protein ABBQ32_003470 [Trebouxia sp. C0010 RCD-2024]